MRDNFRRHVIKKAQINITYPLEHIERVEDGRLRRGCRLFRCELDQDKPATILDACLRTEVLALYIGHNL